MTGETDLETLLATMRPTLHASPYIFCSVSRDRYDTLPFEPLGVFREEEGVTVIATEREARENGLSFASTWACITLDVHSSLEAVGYLAAITARLARAEISVNPVSAYYHDHLFVPWDRRWEVMDELRELIRSS